MQNEVVVETNFKNSVRIQFAKFSKGYQYSDFDEFVQEYVGEENLVALGRLSRPNEWEMVLSSGNMSEQLIHMGKTRIKRRSCWIYPMNQDEIRGFIHWLPTSLPNERIKEFLSMYGQVLFIKNEEYKGVKCNIAKEVRYFGLIMMYGNCKETIPHFASIDKMSFLIIIRGRQPACFHCKNLGHIMKDCSKYQEKLKNYCERPANSAAERIIPRGRRHIPSDATENEDLPSPTSGNVSLSESSDVKNLGGPKLKARTLAKASPSKPTLESIELKIMEILSKTLRSLETELQKTISLKESFEKDSTGQTEEQLQVQPETETFTLNLDKFKRKSTSILNKISGRLEEFARTVASTKMAQSEAGCKALIQEKKEIQPDLEISDFTDQVLEMFKASTAEVIEQFKNNLQTVLVTTKRTVLAADDEGKEQSAEKQKKQSKKKRSRKNQRPEKQQKVLKMEHEELVKQQQILRKQHADLKKLVESLNIASEPKVTEHGEELHPEHEYLGLSHGEDLGLSHGEDLGLSHGEDLGLSHGEDLGLSHGEDLGLSHGEDLGLSHGEELGLSHEEELGFSRTEELGLSHEEELGFSRTEESGSERGAESGSEHGAESGSEHGAESGSEHGAESGSERGEESGSERGAESGSERGAESGSERGKESGSERGKESGSERGKESGSERGEESGSARRREELGSENEKESGLEHKQLITVLEYEKVSKYEELIILLDHGVGSNYEELMFDHEKELNSIMASDHENSAQGSQLEDLEHEKQSKLAKHEESMLVSEHKELGAIIAFE
ncbi:CCHC-type domain-containing protein [Caerostris darwini]|uniref:CCHC-type domain-containing protein n=1 Tax=Caerostris darwini TaxID=1538125 RepID=A0AAV4Q420_9ARAC|nr:CCHC-type domain-containing protein [Caerostris darwini]